MASLLARKMVTIGVAGAYMSGTRGDSVMAPSPAYTGGLPADGWVNPPATSGSGLDNQLGMPGPGKVLEDGLAAMVGLSAETAEAFDAVAEAAEAVAEAAEAEAEAAEAEAEAAAEAAAAYRAQLLQSLGQFDLVGPDAELVAGLLDYERELIGETAGASHVEAVEALVAGVPPEIKQKLRAIETQIRAIAKPQDPVATQLLEGVTIGEILASIPKGVDAEPILEIIRSIVMPAGDPVDVDPEAALEALTQVLTDLEGMSSPPGRMNGERPKSSPEQASGSGSSTGERDDGWSEDRMGAFVSTVEQRFGLSTENAEMLYGVLELEKRVFGAEGLDHDEAESIVLGSSGTPEFAAAFHRLRHIEVKLNSADQVDPELLEAVAIAEIMLKLPAGENGKQIMGAVRAMVTNGHLSYKQVIQLRDSLPDPSVPDPALLGSTTTTTTTTTTSSSDEPSAPTEEEMVPSTTSSADEKAPATSTSDEEAVNNADAPAPVAAELEAHDHGAIEADTGSGLSDQNIIIITAVSILMLVVAGVVAVAAVRRSRRRSNAAKKVSTAVDPLPVPPLSSEYESTAVIVNEDVYSEEMTTAMV